MIRLPLRSAAERHGKVGPHHQTEVERGVGHQGDRAHGGALEDHGHVGAGIERDVDTAGGFRLDQPRAAGESADLEVEPVLFENAGAHADVDQREVNAPPIGLPKRTTSAEDMVAKAAARPSPEEDRGNRPGGRRRWRVHGGFPSRPRTLAFTRKCVNVRGRRPCGMQTHAAARALKEEGWRNSPRQWAKALDQIQICEVRRSWAFSLDLGEWDTAARLLSS